MLSRFLFRSFSKAVFLALYFFLPSMPHALFAQDLHQGPGPIASQPIEWQSNSAQHAYGLPDIKPHRKGTLTLDATSLTFTTKSSNTSIPRASITSVSAGNERVELWGTSGRIMRMAIPQGGGLVAAIFMHHRVDMLTVEFTDARSGSHSVVFYLGANQSDRALQIFAQQPLAQPKPASEGCGTNQVEPRSVLVAIPDWDKVQVPAAYRALVYEHVVDRLKAAKNAGHIYRAGEPGAGTACPQYTVEIAIEGYKKGNQIVRAATGPIGMFASPTQMSFTITYSDVLTSSKKSEQIKASIRTESESTGVADAVAKKLAKQYTNILKTAATSPVHTTEHRPA